MQDLRSPRILVDPDIISTQDTNLLSPQKPLPAKSKRASRKELLYREEWRTAPQIRVNGRCMQPANAGHLASADSILTERIL